MAKKRVLTELVKGPMAKMMPRWLQGYARDPSAVVGGQHAAICRPAGEVG